MENFLIYFVVVYLLNAVSSLSVYVLHKKILKIEEPSNIEQYVKFYYILPLFPIFTLMYFLVILRCYFLNKDVSNDVITEISKVTKLSNERNIGFFEAYGIIQKEEIQKIIRNNFLDGIKETGFKIN